ncbi:unnamed protein product [Polarella glacialis]|uniref:RRM Nup35-type domain-containing protein n=1 Tax=Polarella glacialis TaxID=89957 RepID=A0A813KRE9_POLGL|nr:unnamed protein product [Polarella glacialis]CAE8707406.1 unnamed protein product [Polarella glacialis]
MMSWGGQGAAGAWHDSSRGQDLRGHPTLLAAFGAEPRLGDGANLGGLLDANQDEVPRTFSTKAQQGLGGAGAPGGGGMDSALGGYGGWGNQLVLGGKNGQRSAVGSAGGLLGVAGPLTDRSSGFSGARGSGSSQSCWVTVFGFPGRMAAPVRQQLEALCGPVAEVLHGDGNFMHARFQSAQAANACLALNGQVLLGSLMVGCVPCAQSVLLSASGPEEVEQSSQWLNQGSLLGSQLPQGNRLAGSTGSPGQGPEVRRSGLFWRLLDHIFDI